MSRRPIAVMLAAIAAAGFVGCGGGSKPQASSDPYASFSSHPAAMYKWCRDYDSLMTSTGWTDNQIYNQLKDTGTVKSLSRSTFKAQIRWCFNH